MSGISSNKQTTGVGTGTASNIGTAGIGVFKSKVGSDFEFKKLHAASSKVTLVDNTGANQVDFDVDTTALSIFTVGAKGVVPAPVSGDVSANKVLQADGTWVVQSGGGGAVSSVNTRTGAVTLVATDIPVFLASGGSHAVGAVPDPGGSSGTTKFLREDASWAIPPGAVSSVNTRTGAVTLVATDIPVFIASGGSHAVGAVPDPGGSSGTTKFLREDATWAIPSASAVTSVNTRTGAVTLVSTDIPVFIASGGSHAVGAVPDPGGSSGSTKFLREDATWAIPSGGGGSFDQVEVWIFT